VRKGLVTSSDELKDRAALESLILRGRNVPETSITPPYHARELCRDLATETLVENETQGNNTLRGTYTQLKKDRAESQRFMDLLFLLNGEHLD